MHTSYMYMYINIYNIRYAYFYLEKWASFCSDKGISLYCRSNDIASSLCTVIQVQLPLALFFFSTSLCRFLFPYCSNGNIDLLSIPKDTRIKIHLAFVGIVAAVDPFHHHHVCPPPNDPINHPSDTVYLFYVFLLWVMEEHLLRSSTTQISSPLLFFR
jgi:hypothetical protein